MQASCKQCSAPFEITPSDLDFLEKVSPVFAGKKESIPPPTLCPDCRQQRRLAWRNERCLYHRKCDLTGKQIISMYAPDSVQKVYDQEEWWSDRWDPLAYGREFDFSRPFFDQFAELFREVPRISLMNKEHDNGEFCNFALGNKNSYLCFTTGTTEDGFYCTRTWESRSVCDCSNIEKCELCYEVIDSDRCYNCQYLQNCTNCADCFLGYNLRGCRNCFACYNLHNKQFCIGNVQYNKERYEELVAQMKQNLDAVWANFSLQKRKMPHKYMDCINAEGCTGNAIIHSKNAHGCYEVMYLQDCAFVANATHVKDAMDVQNEDHSELVYEAIGSETNYMHHFNDICWYDKDILCCSLCFHSHHLFGCVGLNHRQYCILNKQYTQEEYEQLVPKIIAHMRKTGEYGEFFPAKHSPYAYNETMAMDHFPLEKTAVRRRGWRWRDEEEKEQYLGPSVSIPAAIEEVDDAICKEILRCCVTGKPYKIIPQELALYRKMKIPIPKKCFEQRLKERNALKNPRKLWKRKCQKCQKDIETTYSPDRPEVVYCERCYLETVY